ncbi:MAG: SpoIIE family protein phosphatase [Actinomycetota bacterium]
MSERTAQPTRAALGRRLWRPPDNREFVLGLVLAVILPGFAAWMAVDLQVFDHFPGVPFLVATVGATMVGRLSASLIATFASGVLVSALEVIPDEGLGATQPQDLIAVGVFVALSFFVAYSLALREAARDDADDARVDVESLARTLAAERNTMQQIMQQMPNGVIVADAEGVITMQNARSREILAYEYPLGSRVESTGSALPWIARRPDGGVYEPGDYPLSRSLRTGALVIGEPMAIERGDGTIVKIDVDSAPIRTSDDHAIAGAVAVFQDVTERIETQERLLHLTKRLQQIQAVTDATLTQLGFDDLAGRLLQTLREVLGTDSATLLLLDRTGTELIEHTTVGVATDGPGAPVPIGRGISGKIASTVSPLVVDDVTSYDVVRHWLTDMMSSLMGVPLVYRGQVRGVIHVATHEPRHFTDDDVEVLELAASRITSALERASLHDSRSAMSRALQRSLLPAAMPDIDGVELAALYRPFSPDDEVGGDFYDVFPHGEGTWGVVVGDVSGKGPDAAAVMGLAAHTIRTLARYEERPSAVLGALNDELIRAERVATERFCTACEMRLHSAADHLRVTICLAGHPLPFAMRVDGRVEHVGIPGTLLGTFQDPELHDVTVDLWPGDAIVAYTDGLVEQRGSSIDEGEGRLAELLSTCIDLSADEIVARIQRALLDPIVLDDDVALVVIKKR